MHGQKNIKLITEVSGKYIGPISKDQSDQVGCILLGMLDLISFPVNH